MTTSFPEQPRAKVSVIIPCHNGAPWIWEQLDALSRQEVPLPWEVLVVDNRSTDLSAQVARGFSDKFPSLRVVPAHVRRGPAYARNTGASMATGDYFLFFDADDVVADGCVAIMVRALEKDPFVAASLDYKRLNPEWTYSNIARGETGTGPYEPFLPYAGGGTIGIRRALFFSVGGFDESMKRAGLEDCDFCWRVELAGTPLKTAEGAVVHYRRRGTIRGLFKQETGFGADMMLLIRKYQRQGYDLRSKTWRGIALECAKLLPRLARVAWNKALLTQWVSAMAFRVGMIAGAFAAVPGAAADAPHSKPAVVSQHTDHVT
jgi:GT2 family glycosyltransferase